MKVGFDDDMACNELMLELIRLQLKYIYKLSDSKQCPYTSHHMYMSVVYVFVSFSCVLPKGGQEGVV